MTVFELLGIEKGDSITVNNPWSDSGERDVIPLSLSRNGISIRAIDCRYGDICYIGANWSITMADGSHQELGDNSYIKEKLSEWESQKNKQKSTLDKIKLEEIEREFASIDDVVNTLNVENLKVAITGTLPLSRADLKGLLESKGAIVVGTVSRNTAYLFMGNTGRFEITSKMAKAHEFGVKIITM